jgi:hypothetical protein
MIYWKESEETMLAELEEVARHLPGGTQETHKKLQSGCPVSWTGFEPGVY